MSARKAAPLLIRAGRVVDPASALDVTAHVLVRDGRIEAVQTGNPEVPRGTEIIDAQGRIVCPGFVDLHTHLRYPGFPQKETIASGSRAAAAGGFTTICAMANTDPVIDCVPVLEHVLRQLRRSGWVKVRQLAAVSQGLLGRDLNDLKALRRAGAVAFSDDGKPVWDARLMERALQWSERLGAPVSVHEEDPDIVRGGMANDGEAARRLGLAPWPCSGEASLVRRDIRLLSEVGGHLHIAHASCAETVSLVRAAQERGLRITAEVTPHHLRLTDRLVEGDEALALPAAHGRSKVNPPLRSTADVNTLVQALADGVIAAVATDHAPHAASDKEGSYASAAFGFSALETALPLLLDLVREGKLALPRLVESLTIGPARLFGLEAGSLRPGAPADICIFDPEMRWEARSEALYSRGKNTPVLGAVLTGRVTHTIVNGKIAHRL